MSHIVIPSPAEVHAGKTRRGGYSRAQLARWGVDWPPKAGWKRELAARYAEQHASTILQKLATDPARLKLYEAAAADVQEAKELLDSARRYHAQCAAKLNSILRRVGV